MELLNGLPLGYDTARVNFAYGQTLRRAGKRRQADAVIGTARELYDAPATPFVARFVGSPPMSLLATGDGAAGPLRSSWLRGPGTLGVRPEHVRLVPGTDAGVIAVEDHGHEAHVVLDLAAGRLVARTAPHLAPRPGGRTGVEVDARHVHAWPS